MYWFLVDQIKDKILQNNNKSIYCTMQVLKSTYSDESDAQTNSWADPKLLFLSAIAV